jgi:hypothetical protein
MLVIVMTASISCAANADVYVISNPSVDITVADIRGVFIGERLLATGVKLAPVDNAAAQAEFLNKVMLLELSAYNAIWVKKGLNDGLNPPDMKASDAEVILYVRKTPGAIGYVTSIGVTTAGFKTIKRF